jgi:hypothetical protein
VPGAAVLRLVPGVTLLRADEQVSEAMLDGWADQQLVRNLARETIMGRAAAVRAFAAHVNAEPWEWTAQMLDEVQPSTPSARNVQLDRTPRMSFPGQVVGVQICLSCRVSAFRPTYRVA